MPLPPIQLPSGDNNSLFFQKLVNTKLDASSSPTEIKKQEKIAKEKLKTDEKYLAIQEKTLKILEKAVFKIQGTKNLNYDDLKKHLDDEKQSDLNQIIEKTKTLKKTLGDWNPLTITWTGVKEKQAIDKWSSVVKHLSKEKAAFMKFFVGPLAGFKNNSIILFKGLAEIGACLGRFLLGPFKLGWKIADKLMYFVGGPIWTVTKKVVSSIAGVGKWLITTGWEAISLIGTGLKTMFNFGVDLVKKTSSFILGGAATFFGWYFKNLFTTLFSPSMWIINIPLFIGISYIIFKAFEGLFEIASGPIYNAINTTFSKMLDRTSDFGKWLWEGAKAGFNWLVNVHIADKSIKEYYQEFSVSLKKMIEPWIGTGTTFSEVINWISGTYTWLTTEFKPWYTTSYDIFKTVVSYIKEMPGRTLTGKFIKKLRELEFPINIAGIHVADLPVSSVFPFVNTAIDYITKKYGFVMSGQSQNLDSALEDSKISLVQSSLERQIVSMKKAGKSEDQINDHINNRVLPDLRNTIFGKIKNSSMDLAVKNAQENSTQILAGKLGLESNAVFDRKLDIHAKLQQQISNINNGVSDYSDTTSQNVKDTFDYIRLSKTFENNDRAKSANLGLVYDEKGASATIDMLSSLSSKMDQRRLSPTYIEFMENDPFAKTTRFEDFSISLAKTSTTISNTITSFFRIMPGSLGSKIGLGFGTAVTGAAGQETLRSLSNLGITSRVDVGNGMDLPQFNVGSAITTGPDRSTSLVEEYFKDFKGVPNITAIKDQAKSDVIDLMNMPYISDEKERKRLVKKYLDNDKYDKLWRRTSHKEFGDGELIIKIQNSMRQLFSETVSRTAKKMAMGGILAKDMNRVIPLDTVGQEYIRDQIVTLSKNKDDGIDINKKKDQKTLTNIINETVYHSDSYEMYSLKQLTKGTLGAL